MDKTFDPAAVEARIPPAGRRPKPSRPGAADRTDARALLDRHPAAERHRLAAHGPRAQQHAAGHPVPLRAHARPRRAVAARARITPASRRRWWSSGSSWSGRSHRRDLGREEFVERVWEWKEESGGAHRQPAASASAPPATGRASASRWTRACRARSLKVFVDLYRAGPDLQGQAPRQLGPEVPDRDLRPRSRAGRGARASLWHVRYAARGRAASAFITVATTRPETMLGDTAVAVHPDDERYQRSRRQERDPAAGRAPHPDRRRRVFRSGKGHRRGQDHARARLQRFRGRQAPRAAVDQHSRPGGAAALKGNEAFRAGLRSSDDLAAVLALDGLDRFDARKRIVAMLEARGALGEDRAARARRPARRPLRRRDRALAHRPVVCEREAARRAARSTPCARASTQFVPETWEKTYFHWLENIRAVVRLAPALVGPSDPGLVRRRTGDIFVARDRGARRAREARAKYGRDADADAATRTCSTPGSPRRCGRSRRSAGRTRRRS